MWMVKLWRKYGSVRFAKMAFIIMVDEGEKIPQDLMDFIIKEMHKEVEALGDRMTDAQSKAFTLKMAVRNRPDGVTKTAIFDQFAEKWGVASESVKKTYYRKRKKST